MALIIGAARARHFLSITPGPCPFSSTKTTPAASSARRGAQEGSDGEPAGQSPSQASVGLRRNNVDVRPARHMADKRARER